MTRVAPTSKLRAVVFDLFITLTDFDTERRRPQLLADLANELGVDEAEFVREMRSSFTERATGRLGDLPAIFAALCGRLGRQVDPDTLIRAVALRLEHERQLVAPREGALAVLARIRELDLQVGVLTDCAPELPPLWPSLAYAPLVDAVVFSCELGVRKPDPTLYTEISRRLGVAPAECLYVGDGGSEELSGARRVGMTAALLRTPFGSQERYDAEDGWDGLEVDDLAQVEGLALSRLSTNDRLAVARREQP